MIKSYGQHSFCTIVKGGKGNFRGRMGETAFAKFCANAKIVTNSVVYLFIICIFFPEEESEEGGSGPWCQIYTIFSFPLLKNWINRYSF